MYVNQESLWVPVVFPEGLILLFVIGFVLMPSELIMDVFYKYN